MADYYTEVMADTPALLAKFEETGGTTIATAAGGVTGDVIGSGHTFNQPGPKPGMKSIHFNGTSGITLPTSFAGYGTSAYTYEAWIRMPVSFNKDYPTVIRRDGNGVASLIRGRGPGTGASINKFEWYAGNLGLYSTASINDDLWHHVVMVKNGATMSGYLDGVLVVTGGGQPTQAGWQGGSMGFGIGCGGSVSAIDNGNGVENFTGYIAAPAIYDGALSDPRILAHYNATAPAVTSYRGWGIKLR